MIHPTLRSNNLKLVCSLKPPSVYYFTLNLSNCSWFVLCYAFSFLLYIYCHILWLMISDEFYVKPIIHICVHISPKQSDQWIVVWHYLIWRDNYNKLTCGMTHFHFAYPWFKTLHFAHLRLVSLAIRNPPLRLPLGKHIFREKQI